MADEQKSHSEQNGDSLKRKRSDSNPDDNLNRDNEDSQEDAKKLKLDDGKAGKAPSSSVVTVVSETADSMLLEIPHDKVGQLIGSKGMVIQEVQAKSGAKAVVNQNFPPGTPRQVQINGTQAQMKNAVDLIKRIIEIGPTAIHVNSLTGGPTITTVIEANQSQIGKIIGTGGANIKEIQSKSGARVQIDQDYPPDVPRKVNITGTSTAVNIAVQMVQGIMNTGHLNHSLGTPSPALTTPAPSYQPYQQPPANIYGGAPAGEVRNTMDVAKAIIGKIIGKGGETIQLIQKKSGCKVTVDQQVPEGYPCKVNFVGTAQTVAIAQHLVQEIMIGVPTHKIGANLPNNVPPTAAAAYPAAPAAAAYPAMPPYTMQMPQQPAYPYAYPPQPYAAQPYPYAMPAAYPPYGQPTAAPAVAPPGGYGAMPGAAGAYNPYPHNIPASAPAAATKTTAPAASNTKSSSSSVWTEHKTDDGIPYWYNASTGVSQVSWSYSTIDSLFDLFYVILVGTSKEHLTGKV